MKKIVSLLLVSSLLFSSCSTLTDYASESIDKASGSIGAGQASGVIKKAVIPKEKSWDDGDVSADMNVVYSASKSQAYLDSLIKNLLSFSDCKDSLSIYMLYTARVQGLSMMDCDVRITRGMFNMIYDEAELACLIGHEIGHNALAEHVKDTADIQDVITNTSDKAVDAVLKNNGAGGVIKRQQGTVIRSKWTQKQESDADKYGAELAAKAGYDPYAFCDLFERLASRIDLGLMYKFTKLEGTHPALDDRAKSLRAYLQKKGYKEGVGKRNRDEYVTGMSQLLAMRTGEGKKDDKNLQKAADEEGKKDLKRLDEIFKEVDGLRKSNKPVSMSRFIEIMDEMSAISQKYGVTAEDVLSGLTGNNGKSFMEESIVQDSPFWEIFKSIKDEVAGKVGSILETIGKIAIGSCPIIGDAIGVYELVTGKDFFTGEKLSDIERALVAFSVLMGVGTAWKNAAKALEREFAGLAAREAQNALNTSSKILRSESWEAYLQTKNYKIYEYKGTTKVAGMEQDVSRRVYQRMDIDPKRVDSKGMTNLERMKKGKAPYLNDGSQVNIHHTIQAEPGPVVEMSVKQHKEFQDVLHGLVEDGQSFRNNPILDKQFENFRGNYWREQAKLFEKGLR